MAQIRTVVPQSAVSNFRPVQAEAGGGFRLLADAMDVAYEYLKPKAIQEMTEKGDALGREIAKQQIGETAVTATMSTKGAAPPADPNAALAADAMAALGKGPGQDKLPGVDPRIDEVVRQAAANLGIRIGVSEGLRSEARQRQMVAEGKSQTMNSKHLHGAAVDYHIIGPDGKPNWDFEAYRPLAEEAKRIAAEKGYAGFVWGGDWKTLKDGVHFQLSADGVPVSGAPAGATPQGTSVTMSAMDGGAEPFVPTVMRDADGKLTSRLFGPTSNPILAAHDAAAGVAYQSDVFLKASADFMGMSEQFALDPNGFKQAADEYVKQMVAAAPEDFRMDIRANLEKEAGRRFLGLMDEKQRDIRQRANNSSGALADRWADDLASAIATGNPEEIAAARAELSSVLAARERLPGLSWTPEQSANFVMKAEEEGQRRIQKAQDEQTATWKSALSTITDAAKAGINAADETILDNPLVQQLLPDEWREAASFTALRDSLPTFNTMTPAAQAQALAEMNALPVQFPEEVDIRKAAASAAAANAKAWIEDPIKRAGEVLTGEPPPPLPELDPTNPDAFMSALAARAAYGQKLVDAGYTPREVYVSKEEAKMLGGMFGKDVPPELKAIAAGAVVGAMGADAEGFFKQISTTDPVIPHVGALMARGGDPAAATEAMTGQALLDQKVVQAPSASAVTAGMAKVQGALAATPGALNGMDGVRKTAVAIYAARIPAGADEETQKQVMDEAWQAALGQSNSLGRVVGGVQEVGGQQVLLPPDVAGEDLDGALKSAFGDPGGFWSWAPQIDGRPEMWMAAAGGLPALGGEVLDPSVWTNGEVSLTPVGGSRYMLSIKRNGVTIDVGVQGQPDDVPFIFDANKLIEANLVPQ